VGPFAPAVARRDHVHSETVRAPRDLRADAAEADDEQRLALDLDRPLAARLAKAARERDGRNRRATVGAGVQQLDPFQIRAARDDLRRAEAYEHVRAADDLGHSRIIAQPRHADDLDTGHRL